MISQHLHLQEQELLVFHSLIHDVCHWQFGELFARSLIVREKERGREKETGREEGRREKEKVRGKGKGEVGGKDQ